MLTPPHPDATRLAAFESPVEQPDTALAVWTLADDAVVLTWWTRHPDRGQPAHGDHALTGSEQLLLAYDASTDGGGRASGTIHVELDGTALPARFSWDTDDPDADWTTVETGVMAVLRAASEASGCAVAHQND